MSANPPQVDTFFSRAKKLSGHELVLSIQQLERRLGGPEEKRGDFDQLVDLLHAARNQMQLETLQQSLAETGRSEATTKPASPGATPRQHTAPASWH